MNKKRFEEIEVVLAQRLCGKYTYDEMWTWEAIEDLVDTVRTLRSQNRYLSDQLAARTTYDCNTDYRFGPGD